MACSGKPSNIVLLLALIMSASMTASNAGRLPSSSLAARLKLDGDSESSSPCWDSLFQLQSCSGELIMFFLNGETYLGPACCKAIRVIQHDCWSSDMLASLGFTAQEGDILKGYCDEEASHSTSSMFAADTENLAPY